MHKDSIPVDMVTVTAELIKSGKLNEVGGPLYISDLSINTGSAAHIVQHSLYIKQEFIKRELLRVNQESIRDIMSGEDVSDVLSKSINKLNVLDEDSVNTESLKHISDISYNSIISAEHRSRNFRNNIQNGIPTGSTGLDKITGGWQNGDVYIIGARPAMGKTAFAIKFLEAAAMFGYDVTMFALEMKGERLIDRIIIEKTGIDDWRYKQGNLSDNELNIIADTSNYLYSLPVYIDDNSSQTVSRIKSKCRLLKKKGKCKLIIIDYLQLTEGEGSSNNREQEIAKISREIKKMAKSLDVPVIVLSQLNRALETRSGKRPQLSDIRESGAIEQDADFVAFIHRPDYYKEVLEYPKDKSEILNGIEFIISKYREGAVGSVYMQHNGALRNIKDYELYTNPF